MASTEISTPRAEIETALAYLDNLATLCEANGMPGSAGNLMVTTRRLRRAFDELTSDGRAAYEADVRKRPTYGDGSPRKTWEQLGKVEQWSWTRPQTT